MSESSSSSDKSKRGFTAFGLILELFCFVTVDLVVVYVYRL